MGGFLAVLSPSPFRKLHFLNGCLLPGSGTNIPAKANGNYRPEGAAQHKISFCFLSRNQCWRQFPTLAFPAARNRRRFAP
jgi:hypothetical protein